MSKGTGFIPATYKFKEEKKPIHKHSEDKKELDKVVLIKTNVVKNKKPKPENFIDKNILNEKEKDGLHSLMGLVTEEVKKDRDSPLFSVEYFYETKQRRENINNIIDENFNSEFLKNLGQMKTSHESYNSPELQNLFVKYNESLEKKIIISCEVLLSIIDICLR